MVLNQPHPFSNLGQPFETFLYASLAVISRRFNTTSRSVHPKKAFSSLHARLYRIAILTVDEYFSGTTEGSLGAEDTQETR